MTHINAYIADAEEKFSGVQAALNDYKTAVDALSAKYHAEAHPELGDTERTVGDVTGEAPADELAQREVQTNNEDEPKAHAASAPKNSTSASHSNKK